MESSHFLFHSLSLKKQKYPELEEQFTHPFSKCLKLKDPAPSESLDRFRKSAFYPSPIPLNAFAVCSFCSYSLCHVILTASGQCP